MNLFRLHYDPRWSAAYMCDKHVVKMILETAQILSTVIRLSDGELLRVPFRTESGELRHKKYHCVLSEADDVLMMDTHRNHPCTLWAGDSRANYSWTYEHLDGLLAEYTKRYGKVHSVETRGPKFYPWSYRSVVPSRKCFLDFLAKGPSKYTGKNLPIPVCMPDEFKVPGNPVESYRNYYVGAKSRFARWKTGLVPNWYKQRMEKMK